MCFSCSFCIYSESIDHSVSAFRYVENKLNGKGVRRVMKMNIIEWFCNVYWPQLSLYTWGQVDPCIIVTGRKNKLTLLPSESELNEVLLPRQHSQMGPSQAHPGPIWGPTLPNWGPTGAHMECCLGVWKYFGRNTK